MAWLGKVSLGNFPDLAGAVNKLSESVKNIEKNFDSALGFEERSDSGDNEASGLWPSSADRRALFDPVRSFMAQRSGESAAESSEVADSSERSSSVNEQDRVSIDNVVSPERISTDKAVSPESNSPDKVLSPERISTDNVESPASEPTLPAETENEASIMKEEDEQCDDTGETSDVVAEVKSDEEMETAEVNLDHVPVDSNDQTPKTEETSMLVESLQKLENLEVRSDGGSQSEDSKSSTDAVEKSQTNASPEPDTSNFDSREVHDEQTTAPAEDEEGSIMQAEVLDDDQVEVENETPRSDSSDLVNIRTADEASDSNVPSALHSDQSAHVSSGSVSHDSDPSANKSETRLQAVDVETDTSNQHLSSAINVSDSVDYAMEIDKVKKEMKLMEAALQGAARQAQAKADDIAKLMNENEQLKALVEDKRKSNEAEIEGLREEYHQRVTTLERKVYALTKERDTLRREQNKRSDAAALLKEKDEIINQVMAEGEELSKKQAVQESLIRKLRAQIREFEEEKKGLSAKLQAEENKVESIKKDKAATEKFLQETIEKHQAELSSQKDHFTNALNAAKEAEALAEARANNEARTELESRLKESGERESTLIQTLEELRQSLTRTEQQAVFREDMLRRDIDDLQKRYHASERRCEELITQVPESTRPLLRQIESMQETMSRRAEAWSGVERSLNSRLQEAEALATTAEENERIMNERLSQTLSRVAVLEAQVSCLRSEQTQLTKSLEKERQRASENRQEYLVAQEAVATIEVRANQLEVEIKDLKKRHKHELQELMANNELLQQEVEREKKSRSELERNQETSSSPKLKQTLIDNGMRKLSSSGSITSMEESYFLQASLDSSDNISEKRYHGETNMNMTPYYLKSMTPSAFEATLRQKDGELASYMLRLASLESIRDSLAEELVKMTGECEKLRGEVGVIPGLRGELEALRRRHSAALELMGERDEELEELRADIVDLKEMYREQVNMLVNKIQKVSSSVAA